MKMSLFFKTMLMLVIILIPLKALAETHAPYGYEPTEGEHLGEKEYSPYLDMGYPQRVFWGDTHLHTAVSTDAGMVGCRLGPDEAYRFARGEMVVSSTGVRTRLQRPLDFLVVADHAENLGLATMIAEKNPDLLKTDFGREISGLVYAGKFGDAYALWGDGMAKRKDPLAGNDALTRSMWERMTASAEKFNEPGKFTALIGYERGVPMGGDLKKAPKGKSPVFMIRALRDVDGANLDRMQIVKGWLDGKGTMQERVYDVVCSDDRTITDKGQCSKPWAIRWTSRRPPIRTASAMP